jgi:alpha-L-rhamnosidase
MGSEFGRERTMATRKRFLPMLAALCAAALVPQCARAQSPAGGPVASIKDFGAVDDGKTLNTAAIQKAIDHVAEIGGGTVNIPAGTYLSGAVNLKPGVNLHLDKDAVLKGSTSIADYPLTRTRIEGHFQEWLPALVNANRCDHLRITGEGTLDGSGTPFYKEFRSRYAADRSTKNLDVLRPRLCFIRDSKDVLVSGLHFKDSAFWNLHLYRDDGVKVEGLDITAPPGSPSTDGIDVDSSRNVEVRHVHVANNDDCICLKGSKGPLAMDDKDSPPVEHIRVSDCTFERGGSFLTCGSEATIIRDVVVEHCRSVGQANKGMAMARLKLRPDSPQHYEDIHFRDITLEGQGSLIHLAPWRQYFDLQGHAPPTQSVKNISIENATGSFGSFGSIQGNPGDALSDFRFENIDLKLKDPRVIIVGVKDLVLKNVKLNGREVSADDVVGR